jgi:hypothetical protein
MELSRLSEKRRKSLIFVDATFCNMPDAQIGRKPAELLAIEHREHRFALEHGALE